MPEHVGRRVDVGLHEPHVGAGPRGQILRRGHGRGGEVQAGHGRPQPGQRDRVGADVALQVHAPQPADVTQPGLVEPDHVAQVARVIGEPADLVVRRGDVCGDAFVPAGPVDLAISVHAGTVSHPLGPAERGGAPPARGEESLLN